jgi:hypothetical protein
MPGPLGSGQRHADAAPEQRFGYAAARLDLLATLFTWATVELEPDPIV